MGVFLDVLYRAGKQKGHTTTTFFELCIQIRISRGANQKNSQSQSALVLKCRQYIYIYIYINERAVIWVSQAAVFGTLPRLDGEQGWGEEEARMTMYGGGISYVRWPAVAVDTHTNLRMCKEIYIHDDLRDPLYIYIYIPVSYTHLTLPTIYSV